MRAAEEGRDRGPLFAFLAPSPLHLPCVSGPWRAGGRGWEALRKGQILT